MKIIVNQGEMKMKIHIRWSIFFIVSVLFWSQQNVYGSFDTYNCRATNTPPDAPKWEATVDLNFDSLKMKVLFMHVGNPPQYYKGVEFYAKALFLSKSTSVPYGYFGPSMSFYPPDSTAFPISRFVCNDCGNTYTPGSATNLTFDCIKH